MNGKVVRLNDYKLTYGKETVYVNIYALFKSKKNGNKYVVYSYDNTKLFYGSVFIRDKEIVVMGIKDNDFKVVEKFVNEYVNNELSDDFDIISLNDIETMQVIDESIYSGIVDIDKLYDLSIPKPEVNDEKVDTPKRKMSVSGIFFIVFLLVVAAFFYINPEVIKGKNQKYVCNKSYTHDKLPAGVDEKVEIIFTSKDIVDSIKVTSNYKFNDTNYYIEFRDKSYFYQYIEKGDTYKFDDDNYTYRLFSNIDTESDYFLPTEKDELISYYNGNGYKCAEEETK